MNTKKSIMIFIGLLIIMAWLLGSVTQAVAETKKMRYVAYFPKAEFTPVGDVEGHYLGTFEFRGLAFVDGEVAIGSGIAYGDFMKGVGPVTSYVKYVFEDGSTMQTINKFKATIAPDGKTGLYEDGKGEFTMGTGRFAGIKGTLSWTGKRLAGFSKETRGEFFTEGTMTYTLPPK
ncbi:MAG TPA: hypothetical protein VK551_03060 [Thermodesulfobacteriota bacterium]|nr:hypothetical protein [Thermodesulfobacteriota bacterium]